MQVKLTMRYYLTSVRMVIIKKSQITKCLRGYGEEGTLLYCWCECKLVQPLWKTVWRFLRKLKMELLNDPATPFLDIYPDRTLIQNDTCTPPFIAALFTTAKTWKQMFIVRWIDKEGIVHVYNGILLSHQNEWNNATCNSMDEPRDY